MNIDRLHPRSEDFSPTKLLKKSHRTRPEQAVGLGIYSLIGIGFQAAFPLENYFLGTICPILLSLGMWTLWRLFSLRRLTLELAIFLVYMLLQMVSHFVWEEKLLELVTLLLLWCNIFLATVLFWKKEKLSGILLVYPVIWIFYLVVLNMMQCMSTS